MKRKHQCNKGSCFAQGCENSPEASEFTKTDSYLRDDFERWVKIECQQSVERYDKYPYSYKIIELNSMWAAWCAAIKSALLLDEYRRLTKTKE